MMPTTMSAMFAALAASTIGFSVLMYGRKQRRLPHYAAGIALMVVPYLLSGVWWILSVSTLLVGGLWVAVQLGV